MTGLRVLLAAGLLLSAVPAQRRRTRPKPPARAEAHEIQTLRWTAAADMQRHAYGAAIRAYQGLLTLDPGDTNASGGLAQARLDLCQQNAWTAAAEERFGDGAATLAACGDEGEAAELRQLAAVSAALRRRDWDSAAGAMTGLAIQPLPAAVDKALAPAWVRFGAGDRRGAARLARAGDAERDPLAPNFAAFLRNRFERRLLWRAALPALAAYLLLLAASLIWGLRRVCAAEAGAGAA